MARRVFACSALVVMVVVLMMEARTEAAISCGQVVAAMTPCVNYVVMGGTVPKACCTGLRQLVAASKANADLQAACGCVKQMAAAIPGLQYGLVNSIPGKCGVSLPAKVTPSLDCSKLHW